ncbi:MAG TPA: class I SAM-dependent methyltransferase [Herpetosiphonaceae bacterium]|nr:class I SAM-dependent methyltransferase [Herpetosiphonaceae bacterium]
MVGSRKKPALTQDFFVKFSNPDRLEAPDRTFVGHRDIVTRSLARYHFVASHLQGATLDVGCGRGYGFDVIQPWSSRRVGIDVSLEFLRDAQARSSAASLVRASGEALPFSRGSFESIIAFEVIEHIENDLAFLDELKRLVRDDGLIAISTPNKRISSGNTDQPLNPFHTREYTFTEFQKLLDGVFSTVILFGQHEGGTNRSSINHWIDRIPIQWKYLLPVYIQGLISVTLRPPLRLEDCRFKTDDLELAHTFLALCRP